MTMKDPISNGTIEGAIEGTIKGTIEEGPGLKETHLERAASILPLPYYWRAAALGALLFAASIPIMFLLEDSFSHAILYLLLSILVFIQILLVSWAHRKMMEQRSIFMDAIELSRSEVLSWLGSQEALIFNDRRMILSGIIVTAIAVLLGLDHFGIASQSPGSYIFVNVYYYLAHYIMGAGLYVWIGTAWMVRELGRLPLQTNVLISRNISRKGMLYSKFTLAAASVYLVWGAFHLCTPQKLSTPISLVWFSSFAVLLCAYFIISQYGIHQLMVGTKKKKMKIFSACLRERAEDALKNPTKENAARLKIMLEVKSQLDEMCEWPFGSYEVLHIALIVVIPIIVVVLEIAFGVIK